MTMSPFLAHHRASRAYCKKSVLQKIIIQALLLVPSLAGNGSSKIARARLGGQQSSSMAQLRSRDGSPSLLRAFVSSYKLPPRGSNDLARSLPTNWYMYTSTPYQHGQHP